MSLTYADAIEHAIDFIGGSPGASSVRDARRAVLQAYRDLSNAHRWSYLYSRGRIVLNAPYVTGTIGYDHEGGTYERQVTLSGGTWPEWSGDGFIRVGEANWKVAERKSATILTLDEDVNPGADVDAGTTFKLFRDTYLLPADFIAQDEALYESYWGGMEYGHPRDWLFSQRFAVCEGTPTSFTITGDQKYPGRLVVRFFPWPDDEGRTVDYVYHRRARDLRIEESKQGTVTASAGSRTVTGAGTAFTAAMVGSILRVSGTTNALPTSRLNENPAAWETTIASFVSATEVSAADAAPQAFSAAKYTVSDPIDIEEGAMANAFLRGIEFQMSIGRKMKDRGDVLGIYRMELERAKGADSRSFARRRCGDSAGFTKRPLWSQPRGYPIDD